MKVVVILILLCEVTRGQVQLSNKSLQYQSVNQQYINANIQQTVFTNITITGWFQNFQKREDNRWATLLGASRGSPNYQYLQLSVSSNKFLVNISDATPYGFYSGASVWTTIITNTSNFGAELNFFAFIRDGSKTTVYINKLKNEINGYPSPTIQIAGSPLVGARSVWDTGPPDWAWDGIDAKLVDIRIYTRALSSAEIAEIATPETAWALADDPSIVLRTCIVTNDTGSTLTGIAPNLNGIDGTYSNSPTATSTPLQLVKPRRATINID